MRGKTIIILAGLLVFTLGCGFLGASDSPDKAAEEWLQAVLDGDGVKLVERTCTAGQATAQEIGLLRSIVGLAGEEAAGDQGSGSIEDVSFDIIENDGDAAQVRVHGTMISAVLSIGTQQEIDETWLMTFEDGKWKWCGYQSGSPTSPGPAGDKSAGQTQSSAQSLEPAWTIQTGDIDELVVSESGTIYGLIHKEHPRRHVTISPDGEILDVVDLPEDDRALDRFFMRRDNFAGMADGTIVIEENGFTALIVPDQQMRILDPLRPLGVQGNYGGWVTKYGDNIAFRELSIDESAPTLNGESTGSFYYFHLDPLLGPVMDKQISLPNISDHMWIHEEFSARVLAYVHNAENKIVLYNAAGELVYNDLPDGLDISNPYDYERYLTPWGDLWLAYHQYDAIGVDQGAVCARISTEGVLSFHDPCPLDTWPDLRRSIRYLANTDKIYYLGADSLVVINRDFETTAEYAYPAGMERGERMMGFDGHLYVWTSPGRTLTKYAPAP